VRQPQDCSIENKLTEPALEFRTVDSVRALRAAASYLVGRCFDFSAWLYDALDFPAAAELAVAAEEERGNIQKDVQQS